MRSRCTMHFTSTAHSSRDRGFSLTEVTVVLGIISVLTVGVCWTAEQATRVMKVTENRLHSALPHLVVINPTTNFSVTNPESVQVEWSWVANGERSQCPPEDDLPVLYATQYSRDGGRTWFNMRDDSEAEPGVRPRDAANLTPMMTFAWAVPADRFPSANYEVRVEAFRDGESLHYGSDQQRAYIIR